MTHREALDCPCHPELRMQVGGGRIYVHRSFAETEGRPTENGRAPDRYCPECETWHYAGAHA